MMKDNSNFKLAVLITTFNGSPTINKTIEKVQESILKFGKSVDVFVFDDCSSDNTVEVIHNSWFLPNKINIIKNEKNIGLFQNKNKGVGYLQHRYDWVLLMDQDDFPEQIWISKIAEVITNYDTRNCLFIWSSYNELETNSMSLKEGDTKDEIVVNSPTKKNVAFWIRKIYTPFSISGSAINTKILYHTGLFETKYNHFGDTDMVVRSMVLGYNHIYIAYPLLTRSFNELQASSRHLNALRDIKEMPIYFNTFSQHLPTGIRFSFGLTLVKTVIRRMVKSIFQIHFKNFLIAVKTLCKLSYLILQNSLKSTKVIFIKS